MSQTASSPPAAAPLQPVILVIFGITGDLAQRKLLPAIYHLIEDDLLHPDSIVLGVSRRDVTADQILDSVKDSLSGDGQASDPAVFKKLQKALRMHQMSLDDGADYDKLLSLINDIESKQDGCLNRLYYLSVPPQTISSIVQNLGEHGHNKGCPDGLAEARLLVEKPFGYDLASAKQLITDTSHWFTEDQLFRIDHYVAKETVQNILAFRLANPLFTPVWNRHHITGIEITAYEQITIEGRAVFYEGVGALRDFIQSHLLQVLALVTMELPDGNSSPAMHAAKQKLMDTMTPVKPGQVGQQAVRGQYEGYRAEVKKPDSRTETYASLTVGIDSDRWRGVPMTIRTGKAMDRKLTEVRLRFKPEARAEVPGNELVFAVQPGEDISLQLNAKKPGFDDQLKPITMSFAYRPAFDSAYERVLLDAVRGDHRLFTTSQEVLAAWRVVEHVLAAWESSGDGLLIYSQGSSAVGPSEPA